MQAVRVRALVEEPLLRAGWVVEDVDITPAGRRSVVRIAVDRDLAPWDQDARTPVPPVSLDEIADATRIVDAALDADATVSAGPYVLEVSSPGVSRPLTQRRHLRRNVGRLVELRLADGTSVAGRILAVDDASVELAVAPGEAAAAGTGTPAADRQRVIPVGEIRSGRVQVEFGRIDADAEDDVADDTDDDTEDVDEPDDRADLDDDEGGED